MGIVACPADAIVVTMDSQRVAFNPYKEEKKGEEWFFNKPLPVEQKQLKICNKAKMSKLLCMQWLPSMRSRSKECKTCLHLVPL